MLMRLRGHEHVGSAAKAKVLSRHVASKSQVILSLSEAAFFPIWWLAAGNTAVKLKNRGLHSDGNITVEISCL